MDAVQIFQSLHGLKPDGDLGRNTFIKMMEVFKMTRAELAIFLGNGHEESNGFERLFENLNYSAKRMLEIFKSDFDTNRDKWLSPQEKLKVNSLLGNPQKIANFVYANQNGNGNEASGDGWRHRGFGTGQVTGKYNQEKFADWIKDPEIKKNPELIATKYAFESFLWYFETKKVRKYITGFNEASILAAARIINIGNAQTKLMPVNYDKRKAWSIHYYNLLA